jgi:hypothetical protein
MRRWWRYTQIGIIALGWTIILTVPTPAQSVRVRDIGPLVYQQLPELPPANQYIDRETQQVDASNTFVGRLIGYHLYTKNRPIALRLDWKHTIADYLGANEVIDPERYPTQKRLQTNPLEGDRAIVQKLTRAQRDRLIQVLVTTLGTPAPTPPIAPTAPPTPTNPVRPLPPRTAPQPGGADLLK